MDFKNWLESRRIYQNEEPEDFEPLQSDDVWRVFHGFSTFAKAIEVAQNGLSGKEKVTRNYSYEINNNPHGLFVTVDFKEATKKFSYGNPRAVMEFHAHIKDLEAPVWPNGRYTIQGEKEGRFDNNYERHQARLKAHLDAVNFEPLDQDRYPLDHKAAMNMKRSYYPALARTMQAGEKQALYVGHLNPNMIKRFWVAEGNRFDDKFMPMTPHEFLDKYATEKKEETRKLFLPNEEFDEEKLVQGLMQRFGYGSKEEALRSLGFVWRSYTRGLFSSLDLIVWPKQKPGLIKFCHRTFGGSPRSQLPRR